MTTGFDGRKTARALFASYQRRARRTSPGEIALALRRRSLLSATGPSRAGRGTVSPERGRCD
jgi:hypothetical protein